MDQSLRKNRHYTTTDLPTLRKDFPLRQNRDVLLKAYGQVCSVWKQLVGVRFKLLGLVPGVSLVLLTAVFAGKPGENLNATGKLLVCALGLSITYGLFVYDWRNSELHNDLISRGRKIEDELGIDTCIFRGRLDPTGLYRHGFATGVIYGATMLAWVVAIVVTLCG